MAGRLPFLPKLESANAISSPQGHSETDIAYGAIHPPIPSAAQESPQIQNGLGARYGQEGKSPLPLRNGAEVGAL